MMDIDFSEGSVFEDIYYDALAEGFEIWEIALAVRYIFNQITYGYGDA